MWPFARMDMTKGRSKSARARGGGDHAAVPEDGGAHRDLRAAASVIYEDAQLTARLPPPSVLALDRKVTGRNLWFRGQKEKQKEKEKEFRSPGNELPGRVGNAARASRHRRAHRPRCGRCRHRRRLRAPGGIRAGRGAVIPDGQARTNAPGQRRAAVLRNHSPARSSRPALRSGTQPKISPSAASAQAAAL